MSNLLGHEGSRRQYPMALCPEIMPLVKHLRWKCMKVSMGSVVGKQSAGAFGGSKLVPHSLIHLDHASREKPRMKAHEGIYELCRR